MATKKEGTGSNNEPEIIGHRGFAGHYPQNTVPGFLEAVNEGVDGLELDVVISADNKVVVSHEPYMSANYMLTPAGKRIPPEEEKSHNLYKMKYEEIKAYEAGLGADREYPQKANVHTFKPLLEDVFLAVENYIKLNDLQPVDYYIELKSDPEDYGIFQPVPAAFVDLVLEVVGENQLQERVVLQSFDPELLNYLHQKNPEIKISFLVYQDGLKEQLSRLNFTPEIYSPNYRLIKNDDLVKSAKEKGMKIIPWTVNSVSHLKRMKSFGVDGIITDYPDKAISLLRE